MFTHPISANRTQRGFSLVEIMVGMIIGLLGMLIIMQVSSIFENQKRTTTSGDDAQNSGAIALNGLVKEAAQAGYGISSPLLMGTGLVSPNVSLPRLYPAIVNLPALAARADAGTDTLIILYGNSNITTEGSLITNSIPTPYTIDGGAAQGINGDGGKAFVNGDWAIPDNGVGGAGGTNPHYLYRVAGVSATTVNATIPAAITQPYVAAPLLTDSPGGPHPTLFNLGPGPTIAAYAVINGSLSVCDYLAQDCAANAAAWNTLSGGIVSMRIACENQSTLRLALTARNSQISSDPSFSSAMPQWHPAGVATAIGAAPLGGNADWQKYRYKVFETIAPIRNAIWSGVQGCL